MRARQSSSTRTHPSHPAPTNRDDRETSLLPGETRASNHTFRKNGSTLFLPRPLERTQHCESARKIRVLAHEISVLPDARTEPIVRRAPRCQQHRPRDVPLDELALLTLRLLPGLLRRFWRADLGWLHLRQDLTQVG